MLVLLSIVLLQVIVHWFFYNHLINTFLLNTCSNAHIFKYCYVPDYDPFKSLKGYIGLALAWSSFPPSELLQSEW